ncbi:MAG: hypothetical protein IT168_29370 [Bryobacterales bacterium]|nr:hypothetical protein [Bryobacterales bacterium]
MLRGIDPQSESFLSNLDRVSARMAKAQREISSGKRLNTVSDSPDDVAFLLGTRSELSSVQQSKTNLEIVKTEVDTAEQTLGAALTALDRVLSLGAQGATDGSDKNARKTLSLEVTSILEQLVNFSNAQVNGRYIFAGDNDQQPPYRITDFNLLNSPVTRETLRTDNAADPNHLNDNDDLAAWNNVLSAYQGSASTRQVQHPQGMRFDVGHTAQEIFDNADPTKNVLQAVNRLRVELYSGESTDDIQKALAQVRTASEHLNTMQSAYGAIQNRITEGLDVASKRTLALQSQISAVEDADITSAILELSDAQFQQKAAYSAEGQRPRQSLFDYLR